MGNSPPGEAVKLFGSRPCFCDESSPLVKRTLMYSRVSRHHWWSVLGPHRPKEAWWSFFLQASKSDRGFVVQLVSRSHLTLPVSRSPTLHDHL